MKPILVALLMVLIAPLAMAQSAYQIKRGDVLEISVLEDPSLNRTALVLPDGRISMPLAGTVQAAGLTIEQVQANLRNGLASNFASPPNVFVSLSRLAEPAPVRSPVAPPEIDVFVLGEVGNPGKVTVEPGTDILQLIAIVGGTSRFAATKRIQIRRTDPSSGVQRVSTFNYQAVLDGAAVRGLPAVADGDVILVPERRLFE